MKNTLSMTYYFSSDTNDDVLKIADFGMAAFLQPNGLLRGRYIYICVE